MKPLAPLRRPFRILGQALRRASLVLSAPGLELGPSVKIAKHVRLRASDGGKVRLASDVAVETQCQLTAKFGKLSVGPTGFIGQGTVIVCRESITIGHNALIAEYVTIRDQDHRYGGPKPTADNGYDTAPVTIGDNVWIGAKATVTKGVTIGSNAVIGAGAVVTRDVPEGAIAVGIPARVVGSVDG